MKRLFALLAAAVLAAQAHAATYEIDPVHSGVTFKVTHMMVAKVPGKFKEFSGTFDYDEKNMKVWKASATIKAISIDTNNARRDDHLRTSDFLDIEKHPNITFVSTGVTKEKGKYLLKGDFTLRGVTKPVALELTPRGTKKDKDGNIRAAFLATGTINRLDYGVSWNRVIETGGVTVGENVDITLDIVGVRKEQKKEK